MQMGRSDRRGTKSLAASFFLLGPGYTSLFFPTSPSPTPAAATARSAWWCAAPAHPPSTTITSIHLRLPAIHPLISTSATISTIAPSLHGCTSCARSDGCVGTRVTLPSAAAPLPHPYCCFFSPCPVAPRTSRPCCSSSKSEPEPPAATALS